MRYDMKRRLFQMQKHEKRENLLYLGLWAILFLSPVLSLYVRMSADNSLVFQWDEVFRVWRFFVPFLVVFLLHNFFIAPWLVYRKKRVIYFSSVACLLLLFMINQCIFRPTPEAIGERIGEGLLPPPPPDGWQPFSPDKEGPHGIEPQHRKPHEDEPQHRKPHVDVEKFHKPPVVLGQHDVIVFVVLVLMLGMNLGVKLYFKSNHDNKMLDELRSKSLQQQLEYLKYQINPHFFMNTLNNIHALVDIEPEKAKSTILELSKLMRYVLYEGAKATVPLQHEVAFLQNYITLMKIRYTDKVRINMDVPPLIPDKQMPPLLLISFVENAFKHGVSYQKDSFIDVQVQVEDERLTFFCRNSKTDEKDENHGGVGLANVKQRLKLLYGSDFSLSITDGSDVYDVRLSIPLNS